MTYRECLAYIYSYTNYERVGLPKYTMTHYDLKRIDALLERMGNPHHAFKSLLISGTKGKGSTAAFAESMIRAGGYRTGLYISPHLHTFRERIQVNGELITEDDVIRLTEKFKPDLEAIEGLTAFEVITGLAFYAFAEANVEVADWAAVWMPPTSPILSSPPSPRSATITPSCWVKRCL
jgi:dihydrofolate synthase/folylpolyglutamate synthase